MSHWLCARTEDVFILLSKKEEAMGKGSNVQKSARAREDAVKRKAKEGSGGGGSAGLAKRTAEAGYVCKQCMVRLLYQSLHSFLGESRSRMPADTLRARCVAFTA